MLDCLEDQPFSFSHTHFMLLRFLFYNFQFLLILPSAPKSTSQSCISFSIEEINVVWQKLQYHSIKSVSLSLHLFLCSLSFHHKGWIVAVSLLAFVTKTLHNKSLKFSSLKIFLYHLIHKTVDWLELSVSLGKPKGCRLVLFIRVILGFRAEGAPISQWKFFSWQSPSEGRIGTHDVSFFNLFY